MHSSCTKYLQPALRGFGCNINAKGIICLNLLISKAFVENGNFYGETKETFFCPKNYSLPIKNLQDLFLKSSSRVKRSDLPGKARELWICNAACPAFAEAASRSKRLWEAGLHAGRRDATSAYRRTYLSGGPDDGLANRFRFQNRDLGSNIDNLPGFA
jgi:hypothetical protein